MINDSTTEQKQKHTNNIKPKQTRTHTTTNANTKNHIMQTNQTNKKKTIITKHINKQEGTIRKRETQLNPEILDTAPRYKTKP